jgi:hypothetical protein
MQINSKQQRLRVVVFGTQANRRNDKSMSHQVNTNANTTHATKATICKRSHFLLSKRASQQQKQVQRRQQQQQQRAPSGAGQVRRHACAVHWRRFGQSLFAVWLGTCRAVFRQETYQQQEVMRAYEPLVG